MQPYDLVVIGSGPGGQRAAIQAAKSGKRVAIIEKQRRRWRLHQYRHDPQQDHARSRPASLWFL